MIKFYQVKILKLKVEIVFFEKHTVGTNIHNIELKPGAGGQLVRSAGSSAQIVSKETPYVQVKLVSGEIRHINKNLEQQLEKFLIQIKKISS